MLKVSRRCWKTPSLLVTDYLLLAPKLYGYINQKSRMETLQKRFVPNQTE